MFSTSLRYVMKLYQFYTLHLSSKNIIMHNAIWVLRDALDFSDVWCVCVVEAFIMLNWKASYVYRVSFLAYYYYVGIQFLSKFLVYRVSNSLWLMHVIMFPMKSPPLVARRASNLYKPTTQMQTLTRMYMAGIEDYKLMTTMDENVNWTKLTQKNRFEP